MKTMVRFELDSFGRDYAVWFRYDPDLIELIKLAVPSGHRSWDSSKKRWSVSVKYAEQLADDMRELGYTVIGIEAPGMRRSKASWEPPPWESSSSKPPPQPPPPKPDWAKLLFTRVGDHRVDPVFRALTRVLHPDNAETGDKELQQELNKARNELRP